MIVVADLGIFQIVIWKLWSKNHGYLKPWLAKHTFIIYRPDPDVICYIYLENPLSLSRL